MRYWNPANSAYYTETRAYNSRLQLTRLTVPGALDMEYRYTANQNNGQIWQQKDWISGEEVTYAYDGLQRLISAATTDTAWGQSFSYDGFGNRTAAMVTKGSAPSSSFSIDAATNRITGFSYDANGNMTAGGGYTGASFDIENRMVSVTGSGGTETYGYIASNKRFWKKKPNGAEEFYFYGISGQKMGTWQRSGSSLVLVDTNLYFGSKMILSRGVVPLLDRLGSNRNGSKYFP